MVYGTHDEFVTVQPLYFAVQKILYKLMVKIQEAKVLSLPLTRRKNYAAGALCTLVYFSALGTQMGSSSTPIAVTLRLCAPVNAPHVCVCGTAVDITGSYGLYI